MKKLFIILVITLMTSAVSFAQSTRYQRGYVKKNGTYVTGHYKTQSDRTNHNNFSTISNTNPYTGSRGSRAKDYSSGAYNYGRGKTVHTGSRGGQYYYNSKGNKTYVPKRRWSKCHLRNDIWSRGWYVLCFFSFISSVLENSLKKVSKMRLPFRKPVIKRQTNKVQQSKTQVKWKSI